MIRTKICFRLALFARQPGDEELRRSITRSVSYRRNSHMTLQKRLVRQGRGEKSGLAGLRGEEFRCRAWRAALVGTHPCSTAAARHLEQSRARAKTCSRRCMQSQVISAVAATHGGRSCSSALLISGVVERSGRRGPLGSSAKRDFFATISNLQYQAHALEAEILSLHFAGVWRRLRLRAGAVRSRWTCVCHRPDLSVHAMIQSRHRIAWPSCRVCSRKCGRCQPILPSHCVVSRASRVRCRACVCGCQERVGVAVVSSAQCRGRSRRCRRHW